jgi:hypothetical protein
MAHRVVCSAAEFGRYRGKAASDKPPTQQIYGHGLMSHHMGCLAHASDDECLSLVACSAFERAAFEA